jgi:MYXO-CTERM domain-containing protein
MAHEVRAGDARAGDARAHAVRPHTVRAGEWRVFLAATALVALHVVDDNFLQPQPGTSAGDHLLSGLVPLGVLVALALAYRHLRAGLRASCALAVGFLGLTVASEAVYYASQGEAGGDDWTGLLCVPAGLVLLGLAAATLWRSRRQTPNRVWRYGRRLLLGVLAFAVLQLFLYPFVTAYVVTHAVTATVPEPDPDLAFEEVSFTTDDGLRLEGWYLPSRNGAAVIVHPGRVGRQDYARLLAEHGYGALLFDRRGEGESEGDPNLLGWGGVPDLTAAVDFLEARPDVDPERIGAIGLSVGGELLLEAAATDERLRAVVSEGAGARSYREFGERTDGDPFEWVVYGVLTGATRVFGNEPVPPNLADLAGDIAPRASFFVYGEDGQPQEIDLNPIYHDAAGEPTELWEVPDAGHIDGLDAQPEEYERRVIGFLDRELLGEE